MLEQLTIKNLAIIDDITIDFKENLNVLTGETGAGKSIIIDAISLIFGARASSEFIAYGKENAYISASLLLDEKTSNYLYQHYDLDVRDEFIITRILSRTGKGSIKINGMIVPLHVINEISPLLIDISSQNESQFLFNKKNHLLLLDGYIQTKEPQFLNLFHKFFDEYNEIKNQYDELKMKTMDESELEYLQFKYQDLKDYQYSLQDEENILKEYKFLTSYHQNKEIYQEIVHFLDDDIHGANSQIYSAIKQLSKVSSTTQTEEFLNRLNSIYLDLSDLTSEFKKSFLTDSLDVSKMDVLSDEITKMNRLKRKYNTNDLLTYKTKLQNDIEFYNHQEIILSKLEKQFKEKEKLAFEEAHKVSKIRQKYALELSLLVKQELVDLYLNDASFSVRFTPLTTLMDHGIDDVEFYMSANQGVPEKPLVKVASGGEVSRIMLGLKSVFTKLSMVDIIIFDEIDTGVSGKVALAMGKKMEKIAKSAQVLAITHLPQVAAMSDHHFYIYKESIDNKTKTVVVSLNEQQKEMEVARLLSGDDISDNFIIAAKELISSK